MWDDTLHHSEFCPDLLCLSVLHFPCLILYDVIHLHANSICTAFSIFPEIINPRPFLRIVYNARVAVCTAHVAVCTAHVAVCTAHVAVCTAHEAVCTAHVAVCIAHVAVCTAHEAVCTAHVAVCIAHVAVHIFLRCWGRDFSVSVLNRLRNLRSRNRGLILGSVTNVSLIHSQVLTHLSTQLAPKALFPGANGRRVKLATLPSGADVNAFN